MTKAVAIWLSVLTVLYLVNLVGDLLSARRIRELEAKVRELEAKK